MAAVGVTSQRSVMIIGAGGHARVVASILALDPSVILIGVADRTAAQLNERIGPTSIVSTIDDADDWRRRGADAVVLALGDNRERAAIFDRLEGTGWEVISAIHPTATIESGVTLGRGCVLCARSVIGAEASLGNNVLINTAAIVDHESSVADHAHIGPGVVIAGRVRVGSFAFVGAGSTVRDGAEIGSGATIGCGSVVISDIPSDVIAYGVPAQARRKVD